MSPFKKVYLSSVEGPNRRGRPLGRWEDRVKEYVSERGVRGNGLEWARRECMDRERWRSVCRAVECGRNVKVERRGHRCRRRWRWRNSSRSGLRVWEECEG